MECSFILITVFILIFFSSGIESVSLTVRNNCPYTIWPAIIANAGTPQLGTTGFALSQGASSNIDVPAGWAGRIWARTFCGTASGLFKCLTGDCGTGRVSCNGNDGATPASLAELQLNGFSNNDYYDVSLVNGFNLPVTVSPQRGECPSPSCSVDINPICPSNLAIGGSNGRVIGCRSHPQLFKSSCSQAYANPDDQSTYSCTTGGDYVISFCFDQSFIGMLCIL